MTLDKIRLLTESLSRVEENLKEEMAILEFILERSTDGYWDWNIEGNYEYLSPKLKDQLGYSEKELEHTPDSWKKICTKESLKNFSNTINSVLEGKQDDFEIVLDLIHKNGETVKVLRIGRVISKTEDGAPIRVVGTHRLI